MFISFKHPFFEIKEEEIYEQLQRKIKKKRKTIRENVNIFIYFIERNGIIRFFSKPLYQPSSNSVSVIPFENGKFKPDDTKTFFIGMVGMGKSKKDNVLKPNGISGPGQYIIQFHFFLEP